MGIKPVWKEFYEQYLNAQELPPELGHGEAAIAKMESPREPGVYKVNFDGAIFTSDRDSGMGGVIRDCNGVLIVVVEFGLRRILLEGDSKYVIEGIANTNSQTNLSAIGNFIDQIKTTSHTC
ncbi:unnamed protein product [Ilex paraguariensis]|uniref:RNase H type-1 domain-containing protein n=1 Tax=Ilex paraguariensis TaxID=185542 RepID=A0ABC8UFL6_9AQUA